MNISEIKFPVLYFSKVDGVRYAKNVEEITVGDRWKSRLFKVGFYSNMLVVDSSGVEYNVVKVDRVFLERKPFTKRTWRLAFQLEKSSKIDATTLKTLIHNAYRNEEQRTEAFMAAEIQKELEQASDIQNIIRIFSDPFDKCLSVDQMLFPILCFRENQMWMVRSKEEFTTIRNLWALYTRTYLAHVYCGVTILDSRGSQYTSASVRALDVHPDFSKSNWRFLQLVLRGEPVHVQPLLSEIEEESEDFWSLEELKKRILHSQIRRSFDDFRTNLAFDEFGIEAKKGIENTRKTVEASRLAMQLFRERRTKT